MKIYNKMWNDQIKRFDRETLEHSSRVETLSIMIANLCHVSEEDKNILKYVSKFHDIGKLKISKRIIGKTSKLSQREYEIIKQHPITGVNILKSYGIVDQKILDVVGQHHENWDGTGYPDKLKGLEISFLASVVHLADVIEALSVKRPYKKRWSVIMVKKYLKRDLLKGKRFNPFLLNTVINNFSIFNFIIEEETEMINK